LEDCVLKYFISMLKNARHENHKKQDEKDYNIPIKVSKRY
jgi:hypothetical protein